MADDTTPPVEKIQELSVDKAKQFLADLSPEQLQELRGLETNDGGEDGRATMLAAIDAELAKREPTDDAASAEPVAVADPQPAPEPATIPTDASAPGAPAALTAGAAADPAPLAPDVVPATPVDGIDWKARATTAEAALDAIGQAIGNDAFTQDNGFRLDTPIHDKLAALVANRVGQLGGFEGEVTQLRDKIVQLESARTLGVAPIGTPLADHRHLAVTAAPASLALVLLDGVTAASGMLPIPGAAEEFQQRSADTVVYQRAIDLFPTGPAFILSGVQLVSGSVVDGAFAVAEVIDTCPVMPPLAAGGGRSAQLPPGTLMFRQPAKAAAEDAAARAALAA